LKNEKEQRKPFDMLTFVLSVIAILTITVVGMVLLRMETVEQSVIMEPEIDVNYIEQPEENNNDNTTKININTASVDELVLLTGIGEAKAKSIIAYREKNPFYTVEDIKKVSGIGEKLYNNIADKICVE